MHAYTACFLGWVTSLMHLQLEELFLFTPIFCLFILCGLIVKSNIVKGDDAGLKDRERTQGDRFSSQPEGKLGQE